VAIRAVRRRFMRETTIESFSADPLGLLQAAQEERVLVTRAGKPLALVVGVEYKDQEDWDLEMSPEFWQMIQQRRDQTTVPLVRWSHLFGTTSARKEQIVMCDEFESLDAATGIEETLLIDESRRSWRRGGSSTKYPQKDWSASVSFSKNNFLVNRIDVCGSEKNHERAFTLYPP
jgi:antitoxin (DNA-binding transcriptional repressor) of toxin-antitoxin stability system